MRQLWIRIAGCAAALGFAATLGVGPMSAALAQQRMIPIPAKAIRADITFDGSPDLVIDGKTVRLAPGARIYGRDNLIVMSGSLSGTATAKIVLEDTTGNLMTIWILTDEEIATPDDPKP